MVLPASCPHSKMVTMGNCRHEVKVLDIPLSWGWSQMAGAKKNERNYVHQSFVVTHKSGKCAVSTRSYQRHVAR